MTPNSLSRTCSECGKAAPAAPHGVCSSCRRKSFFAPSGLGTPTLPIEERLIEAEREIDELREESAENRRLIANLASGLFSLASGLGLDAPTSSDGGAK